MKHNVTLIQDDIWLWSIVPIRGRSGIPMVCVFGYSRAEERWAGAGFVSTIDAGPLLGEPIPEVIEALEAARKELEG